MAAGASSDRFLAVAVERVKARGGRIAHLDVTSVCEAPRIGPHRDAMRANIAALAGVALERVAVKATTSEKLGFTGRGEGIAAYAIATVRLPGRAMNETCVTAAELPCSMPAARAAGSRDRGILHRRAVAGALTEIAGSSDVLDRGFVTYSNEAKQQMLGVPASTSQAHGAVSQQTAEAMARGALGRANADLVGRHHRHCRSRRRRSRQAGRPGAFRGRLARRRAQRRRDALWRHRAR